MKNDTTCLRMSSGELASSDTNKATSSRWFLWKQCTEDRLAGDTSFQILHPTLHFLLCMAQQRSTFLRSRKAWYRFFPRYSVFDWARQPQILFSAIDFFKSVHRFLQAQSPFFSTSLYQPVLFKAPGNMQRSSLCTNTVVASQISPPVNYRPISLLPVTGKVMDDIQLELPSLRFPDIHQVILHASLWICSPKTDSTSSTIYNVNKWTHTLVIKRAVFSDFGFHESFRQGVTWWSIAQACPMRCLVSSLAWICNYFSGHHITVRVGETPSVPQPISAGVPQGSHLVVYFSWSS